MVLEKDEVPPNRLACRWGAACWPLWLLVVRGSVRRAVNTNSDFRFQLSDGFQDSDVSFQISVSGFSFQVSFFIIYFSDSTFFQFSGVGFKISVFRIQFPDFMSFSFF